MSCCCQDCDCAVTGCGDGCGAGAGEIVLFGVRMKEDPMRKCLSMNNLSDYQHPHQESSNVVAGVSAAGYASAGEGGHRRHSGNRERKRGVPWTEEEHKLFLLGLQKVGKGDWRGISRNFVKTRTPTQVASHAQKYFLRQNNLNRRRRRSSLFDITTDSVTAIPMEEGKVHQESKSQLLLSQTQPPPPLPGSSNITGSQVLPFPVSMGPVLIPVQIENGTGNLTLGHINQVNHEPVIRPISFFPMPNASTVMRANINQISSVDPSPLSLKLSLTSDQNQPLRHSVFQVMPSFNNGDNIISVS